MPSGTVRPDPTVDPAGGARKESSPIAPERTPRPGGPSLPGNSRSALVKAGPTSVDQYSLNQYSAPGTAAPKDDEPSREEVQQRISNLYDRVENAGGNFNATRAATAATRTVKPASGNGKGRGGATDAAAPLPEVAKRWFDVGRSQLGPVVPAMLPPDRMPDRLPDRGSAGSRPADSGARPSGRDGRGETADKPVLELTAGPSAGASAGPVAELTARPVAELTAGPVAALPAVPAQRQASGRAAALPGPAAASSQSSLRTSKQRNQRKLGQARELLAGHAARRSAPVAAIESRPESWPESGPVESAWRPAEVQTYPWSGPYPGQQPSTGYGTEPYTGSTPYTGTDMRAGTDQYTGAAAYSGTATYPGPGTGAATDQSIGGGMYLGTDQYAGTGMYVDASTPIAAGVVRDMQGASTPAYATPEQGYATPAPGYGVLDSGYAGKAARAVDFARGQIGKPCVWGAMGPGSYDCSSLTQAAWRAAGVALPRAVHEQATAGTMVPVSDIRLGDLILFSGPVGHVGICTGNGMMIHAPSPGAAIREESIYWAGESAIHSVIRPV